jgi:hypothetical protein
MVDEARKFVKEAEVALASARKGFELSLSLAQPLGLVVNPDGVVSKTTGQGEKMGCGCRIIEAGNDFIASVHDLKAAIAAYKLKGEKEITLVYRDPVREAKAIAEASRRRAALAAALAKEAADEATRAEEAAAAEARRAGEISTTTKSWSCFLNQRPTRSLISTVYLGSQEKPTSALGRIGRK